MSWWAKMKVRKKLIDTFKSGGIHLTYEMSDETKRLILPKIHSVDLTDLSTQLIFTLPNGLDPKLLQKHFYVFQQYFGRSIELEGDYKRFTLTVYNGSMPAELPYKFKDIMEHIGRHKLPIIAGKDRQGRL